MSQTTVNIIFACEKLSRHTVRVDICEEAVVHNIHRFENFRIKTEELLNPTFFYPFFYIEDGQCKFPQNIFSFPPDYTAPTHLFTTARISNLILEFSLRRLLWEMYKVSYREFQSSSLKMEVADYCEILAAIYQTILCHIPEKKSSK
jgi:hypothetical protein